MSTLACSAVGVRRRTRRATQKPHSIGRGILLGIGRESRRQGLDPVMVAAVIEIESRFDPFAKSHVGACGLMQLMPPTARELLALRNARVDARHLFNPVLNIELGTAYLARLLHR